MGDHVTGWGTASAGVLLALLLLATSVPSQSEEDIYRYTSASRDGIGKVYMGREIAHVMGHRGAAWLQRPEREQRERTDLLLSLLPLHPGDVVADIGAGTGYFSMPIADIVGKAGRVLAVDIQPEMLEIIQQRARAEGVSNVEPVLASDTNPMLARESVDLVLMVDAYHEFAFPREVLLHTVASLSERGRVVLVEYRAEDRAVPIKRLHKMTLAQAELEMTAVGLILEQVHDALPWQHVMIFRRQDMAQRAEGK
ncbi:MAG: class I SAM-dependent methyltransferase [Halioglobus sp.]|nr:class I SAM-dependent methyltransferase [Halioglobus sp.]